MKRWLIRLILAAVLAAVAALALMAADGAGRFNLIAALRAVAFDQSFVKFVMSGLGDDASQGFDAFITQHPGLVTWIALLLPALGVVTLFMRQTRNEPAVTATDVRIEGTESRDAIKAVGASQQQFQAGPRPEQPAPKEDRDIVENAIAVLGGDTLLTDEEIRNIVAESLRRAPKGYAFEYLEPVFHDIGAKHESRGSWAEMLRVLYHGDDPGIDVVAESTRQALRSRSAGVAACTALRIMDAAFRDSQTVAQAWRENAANSNAILDALFDALRSQQKSLTVPVAFALFWLTLARNFGKTPPVALRADDISALADMVTDPTSQALAINRGSYVLGKAVGGKMNTTAWLDWAAIADTGAYKSTSPVEPPVLPDETLPSRVRRALDEAQLDDKAKFGLGVLALRLGEFAPVTADVMLKECVGSIDRELLEEIVLRLAVVGTPAARDLLARLFDSGNAVLRLRAFLGLVSLKDAARLKSGDAPITKSDDTVDYDAAIARQGEH